MSRPKKQSFIPVFSIPRQKWVLEIPASVSGKRSQRFFSSQGEALEVAAAIVRSVEAGSEVTLPAPKVQGGNTIATMAAAYLAERKGATSAGNLKNLSWGLSALVEKCGKLPPEELTPKKVDSWVKGLDLSTRGRFNAFAVCRTFYEWPLMRDVVKDNPFRDAPPKKDKGKRLEILTPEEMAAILSLPLKPFFKSWIVAGGFAGLRTVEFSRLSHEAIDWTHKEIVVRKEDAKQGEAARPRSITIQDALARHMPRLTGPLDASQTRYMFDAEMEEALKAIKRESWPKNCLRHSFASYHLAHFRDSTRTAYELGHTSPTLLYSTYGNAVSRKDAEAWWNL